VPDADIPEAVRDTGVEPVELVAHPGRWAAVATDAVESLLAEVEGSIAVVTPARHAADLAGLAELSDRVVVIDPMSTKGLEYDATVIVDPDEITAESPGGVRVLYVALTRAAHRMTVVRPA
jgi:superfamily I DNA/RNA helicase